MSHENQNHRRKLKEKKHITMLQVHDFQICKKHVYSKHKSENLKYLQNTW